MQLLVDCANVSELVQSVTILHRIQADTQVVHFVSTPFCILAIVLTLFNTVCRLYI